MYEILRYLAVPTSKVKKHWSRKQDYSELADQYCYTIYRVNRLIIWEGVKNFDLLKFDLWIISLLFFFDAVRLVGLGVHVQNGPAGRVGHFTEALVPGHGGGGRATEKRPNALLLICWDVILFSFWLNIL